MKNFLAISNDELAQCPPVPVGKSIKCLVCNRNHPIEYSSNMGFYKCDSNKRPTHKKRTKNNDGMETYICIIDGKDIQQIVRRVDIIEAEERRRKWKKTFKNRYAPKKNLKGEKT